VVPSGASLGTLAATSARLAILAIDNAGTIELAVCNLAGGINLDETTLISTTAISASATSASTIYSTTARTSVPFRVVGFLDITEATAGTWATAPTLVQGAGGGAWVAMGPSLLSSNGYLKLPNGTILQWGTATTNASGVATVTWPLAFPTAALGAVCAANNSTASNAVANVGLLGITSGVFYGTNGNSGAVGVAGVIGLYYWAWGK